MPLGGPAVSIHTGLFFSSSGVPEVFANPTDVAANSYRLAYPGESGIRNNLRGQGYFGVDMGLSKSFKITERQNLQFRWEVFNITNSVRFDVHSLAPSLVNSSFGTYSGTLTNSRVMQFALRYSF